jgi:hypothetical protein
MPKTETKPPAVTMMARLRDAANASRRPLATELLILLEEAFETRNKAQARPRKAVR